MAWCILMFQMEEMSLYQTGHLGQLARGEPLTWKVGERGIKMLECKYQPVTKSYTGLWT